MRVCKGLCNNQPTNTNPIIGYKHGYKFCGICQCWFYDPMDKIQYCPCCNSVFRSNTRGRRLTKRYTEVKPIASIIM